MVKIGTGEAAGVRTDTGLDAAQDRAGELRQRSRELGKKFAGAGGRAVVTIKTGQSVFIGDDIEIIWSKAPSRSYVKLMIRAPKNLYITRGEKPETPPEKK